MPSAANPAAPATIHCFKPGRHVAMSGEAISFAQSDLAATAGAYDPALHEAPLVIGHPTLDAPAYGWVGGLKLAKTGLEAAPRKVDPAFAAAVESGHLGKVSAAFYAPNAANNPVPGVYYLRHIGFLGAASPAVKGLRDPAPAIAAAIAAAGTAYSEPEPGTVVFADWDDMTNASLWRSLRDWFIGQFGLDAADKVLPTYQIGQLETSAAAEDDDDDGCAAAAVGMAPAFASRTPRPGASPQTETTVTPAEKLALEAENQRLREQLAASANANKAARLAGARAAAVAFADGLVGNNQLPTGERDVIVALELAIANQAEAADGAALQFGEGDARAPLLPAVRALLAKLPPLVAQGQHATAARAAAGGAAGGTVAFAAPAGVEVDQARLAQHHQALAWQAAHPGSSYLQAVRAVGA